MAVAIRRLSPVAHVPLVLGVLRKLEGAQIINTMLPPHPAHVAQPRDDDGNISDPGRIR